MKPADFKYSGLKYIRDSCVVMASLESFERDTDTWWDHFVKTR